MPADPPGRLRVLVLAESLPWPALKGGDLRTWQHVHALAGACEVGVFGLCSNDARRHRAPGLPLAFWRASTDPALASPPPRGPKLAARAWLLDPRGHPSDLLTSAEAAAELSAVLREFAPDVVLVEGLWLHGYLELLRAEGRRVILDCFNVESALYRELAGASRGGDLPSRVIRDVLPARTEVVERAALAAVDQIWVCSDEDRHLLQAIHAPGPPVVVVPNGVEVGGEAARRGGRPGPDAPLALLFPGFFAYLPNAIAAAFLVDEVFPRLVARSAFPCVLQLVGASPTGEMRAAAARDPRIVVPGPVRDLGPWMAGASVLAVPLFQGGGTRLKILEAFAAGLPVVSTAKGAEGLGAVPGRHLLLAETADAFVAALRSVREDPGGSRRRADAARGLVAERFAWDVVAARVRRAVERLRAEVPAA